MKPELHGIDMIPEYSGTCIDDLMSKVDVYLRVYSKKENAQVCQTCLHTLGEHSYLGRHCPSEKDAGPLFLETVFTPQDFSDFQLKEHLYGTENVRG